MSMALSTYKLDPSPTQTIFDNITMATQKPDIHLTGIWTRYSSKLHTSQHK